MLRPRILLTVILFLAGISTAQALTVPIKVEVTPPSQTVSIFDSVDVDIQISGLGNMMPDSLGGFDLDINYDSSILTFQSATLGNQLDFGGGSINSASAAGSNPVSLFEVSLESAMTLDMLQAGSFLLASLNFLANDFGTSPININNVELASAIGGLLTAEVINGSVSVVPIPAAFWLFGSGLLGMFAWTKRKSLN